MILLYCDSPVWLHWYPPEIWRREPSKKGKKGMEFPHNRCSSKLVSKSLSCNENSLGRESFTAVARVVPFREKLIATVLRGERKDAAKFGRATTVIVEETPSSARNGKTFWSGAFRTVDCREAGYQCRHYPGVLLERIPLRASLCSFITAPWEFVIWFAELLKKNSSMVFKGLSKYYGLMSTLIKRRI